MHNKKHSTKVQYRKSLGPKHFKKSLCATLNISPIDIFTPYTMSKPSMVEGDDQPNAKNNEDIIRDFLICGIQRLRTN